MSTSTLEALRALQTAEPAAEPRTSTRAVLAGLAIVGLLAAAAVTYSFMRENSLSTLERKAVHEMDAIVASSARFGFALRTFGVTREPENEWFSRTSALLAELHQRAKGVDATLAGIAMRPRLHVAESLQAAGEAMERARANVETNKNLMARDVLESNGYPAADALDRALLAVRTATADELGGMRNRWRLAAALALAVWALAWGLGLAWFGYLRDETPTVPAEHDVHPRPVAVESVAAAGAAPADSVLELVLSMSPSPPPVMCDSATVADACETVAGLNDAAQIGPALEGIAQALGASGLVLWVRDGDTLAAAAAHGYPADLPQRLGRVRAGDRNLIARAWQERASQTAPEAPGQRAAVAAPIGAAGVVTGVLSAEFPAGREADADVVATSRILAAQLSVVLGDNGAAPHLEATGS